MKIVLSHSSAFEYWRAVSAGALIPARTTRASALPDATPKTEETTAALLDSGLDLTVPIHVLASRAAAHPPGDMINLHTTKTMPSSSLMLIANDVYVVSPPYCLLQMATSSSLIDVIRMGFELCGTYAESAGIHFGCQPVTRPLRLQLFAERAQGQNGIKTLRRALPHILPNSASPAETAVAMLLSLPHALGGYALPNPQLNVRIDPGKSTRSLVSQEFYRCDLYWKEFGVAVEYDSDAFHTGAEKIARDSRRRTELEALGIDVFTVTSGQLRSGAKLGRTAHALAKRMGQRIQPRCEHFLLKQSELLRTLAAPSKEVGSIHLSNVCRRTESDEQDGQPPQEP